jgi:hypothetical protein
VARFELNKDFAQELRRDDDVQEIVQEAGEAVLGAAVNRAEAVQETGDFAKSIKGKKIPNRAKGPGFYRVYSDDPGALAIEFGTAKTDGKHVLRDALNEVAP